MVPTDLSELLSHSCSGRDSPAIPAAAEVLCLAPSGELEPLGGAGLVGEMRKIYLAFPNRIQWWLEKLPLIVGRFHECPKQPVRCLGCH